MKLHFIIPQGLKTHVDNEISCAEKAYLKNELKASWHHLERAHILGQAWPIQHTLVHWRMMVFAFKIKNIKEIIGQIPRLLVGGIKSFVAEIPLGNSGGADVPPLKPMEIPRDLKAILDQYQN